MKKFLVAISIVTLICGFNSCGSLKNLDYPEPEFDKPSSYVIDSFMADGSFEDYIKLHNFSSESDIGFNVYVHHPDTHEWVLYGTGHLMGAGDTDTIDTDIRGVDDYRYFAIEPLNGKKYKYSFYCSSNDLHVNIMDN